MRLSGKTALFTGSTPRRRPRDRQSGPPESMPMASGARASTAPKSAATIVLAFSTTNWGTLKPGKRGDLRGGPGTLEVGPPEERIGSVYGHGPLVHVY